MRKTSAAVIERQARREQERTAAMQERLAKLTAAAPHANVSDLLHLAIHHATAVERILAVLATTSTSRAGLTV
jgi:hypothetical protein